MVEPPAAQRLRQRLGDVLLTDDLGEGARPVLAVERQRHCASSSDRAILPVERGTTLPSDAVCTAPTGDARAPRAPVRARLSLLPSGPGEVHEMHAARGADDQSTRPRVDQGCAVTRPAGLYPGSTEDSPRGLGRTLGKRVGLTPSRVRISYPPPPEQHKRTGPAPRGPALSRLCGGVSPPPGHAPRPAPRTTPPGWRPVRGSRDLGVQGSSKVWTSRHRNAYQANRHRPKGRSASMQRSATDMTRSLARRVLLPLTVVADSRSWPPRTRRLPPATTTTRSTPASGAAQSTSSTTAPARLVAVTTTTTWSSATSPRRRPRGAGLGVAAREVPRHEVQRQRRVDLGHLRPVTRVFPNNVAKGEVIGLKICLVHGKDNLIQPSCSSLEWPSIDG